MSTGQLELEIVEDYELLGEKRYRLRIKGTSIYLNVSANNEREALEKAQNMIRELQLDKLVREILRRREVRSVIAIILSSIEVIEALEKAIDRIDSEIRAIATKYREEISILMSVPGVSFTLAAAILSEIGDISRFPSPGHLSSYAGLAPTVKESGGKIKLVKTSRKSNKYLRRYMFIAAMAAMRSKSPKIRSFADRLLKRGKHYKAVVTAVARKMLTIIWHLLNRRTPRQEENYEKKAKANISGEAKTITIEEAIKILEIAEKKRKHNGEKRL